MLDLTNKTYDIAQLAKLNVVLAAGIALVSTFLFSNIIVGAGLGIGAFIFAPDYLPAILDKAGFKPIGIADDKDAE
jgi:hypothetical protein